MKIEFDPIADAMHGQLTEGGIEKTKETKHGIVLDYDTLGAVLGIEVISVNKRAELLLEQAAHPSVKKIGLD